MNDYKIISITMFNKVSKAGTGLAIVLLLETVFPWLGVELPTGAVASFVDAWGVLLGMVLLIWGQLDREDLSYGLLRK